MNSIPWIEKYRPKSLDEIVGNQAVIDVFKIFSQDENMPHIIIAGTPGIGKTTVANALLNHIFKDRPETKKESVLELNASDERGVDVVRIKIKGFLQKKLTNDRFLILDESDSMTTQAQQSMRRLLEKHQSAKFIFICNDITKISDTIQSRCAILRLSKLSTSDIETIIKRTAEAEGLSISDRSVRSIAETAEGDARQGLNLLQTVAAISKDIDVEIVQRMSHIPPIETIQKIFSKEVRQKDAISLLDGLFEDGYSSEDISKIIFKLGKDTGEVDLLDRASNLLMKLSDSSSKIHFYAAVMGYKKRASVCS
ncbi:replication factor C subunit 2/4 [Nematocida minor]|uniref:replication factor C subunit 2/4 n=1 Tax=Nematocida minor TaxID=1912983 RepID=UPI00221F56A6|nr:replication factor C subunit 2/4 [Nematocida minor]KAI5192890.1 replication factor C subunit 2/4 [Nematocida minor]